MRKTLSLLLFFLFFAPIFPASVRAAAVGGGPRQVTIGNVTITVPDGFQFGGRPQLENLVTFTIELLLYGGFMLSIIFLIIGGIKWITSGGNKEATASAKGTVTTALVGMVLLASSFLFLALVQIIFQINLGFP